MYIRGKTVLDQNYQEKRIEIAFQPKDGKFAVTNDIIKKDPEFIPNISEILASGKSSRKIINEFLEKLQTTRPLSEDEEEQMSLNIDRVFDL